jgi:hypothetical protein
MKNKPICTICKTPIEKDHVSVSDEYGDIDDRMHLGCSIEISDGDFINDDFWD